jgi:hypothetical protein
MQSGYQRSKSSGVAVTQPAGCGGEGYERKRVNEQEVCFSEWTIVHSLKHTSHRPIESGN